MMLTVPVATIYLFLNVLILLSLTVVVLTVTVMMLLYTAVRYTLVHYILCIITDTTRIWNSNPYAGMVRLQGGYYSNEGLVEVYCNGQWGTICSTGFSTSDANTICRQLGYDSGLRRYDSL